MAIILGRNQYGKAEVRLVHVDRSDPAAHRVTDVNVSTALRGDFTAAHTDGDNSHVLATDTQKNTVHAFARDGVGEIEQFGLRLARHFVESHEWATAARIEIEEYEWRRIAVDGAPHGHAFSRGGPEYRTAVVIIDRGVTHVISGLAGLPVLKSTGAEFRGFPRDRYTTLAEADDRVLATEITARWRYTGPDVEFGSLFPSIRNTLLETFAQTYSLALQHTLYAMGRAVLAAHPQVAEIRLSLPNKHHVPVDLERFGLDNPDTVFQVADRPYGKIEGAVLRDEEPPADAAWSALFDFR